MRIRDWSSDVCSSDLRDAKPGWPLDFRYRVLGTFADEHMLARYTGTCMSDLPHQQPGSRIWQSLEAVTTQQVPRVNRVPYIGQIGSAPCRGREGQHG